VKYLKLKIKQNTLKVKAVRSSKMLVLYHIITWYHNPGSLLVFELGAS